VRTEIEVCGSARLVGGLNASFDAEPEHTKKIGQLKGTIPRTGQSRRGTSKHLSVQPVDEQVHSVVALIRISRLAKIDSQPLPV
jgi:hypothetical protein